MSGMPISENIEPFIWLTKLSKTTQMPSRRLVPGHLLAQYRRLFSYRVVDERCTI
jgi:hypothetical protein